MNPFKEKARVEGTGGGKGSQKESMNYSHYIQKQNLLQVGMGDALTFALIFKHKYMVKVVPCYPKTKAFCQGYGPHKKSIKTDRELYDWLLNNRYNYALLTGTGIGDHTLVVVDFDDPAVYELWQSEVGEDLQNTFRVKTNRGMHVYYYCKDARSWRGDGFEVMGKGKAVMGPMSIHPLGGQYLPQVQPYVLKIDTLSDFPLLSESRPELSPPPKNAPESVGGGLVARIKKTWRIYDLIGDRGELASRMKLKTSDRGVGRWYMGFCPFHDDKNKRSLWIDAGRNQYGCHSCDAEGDVINFYAAIEGVTVRDAITRMRGVCD